VQHAALVAGPGALVRAACQKGPKSLSTAPEDRALKTIVSLRNRWRWLECLRGSQMAEGKIEYEQPRELNGVQRGTKKLVGGKSSLARRVGINL